jgi:hypothetical protein
MPSKTPEEQVENNSFPLLIQEQNSKKVFLVNHVNELPNQIAFIVLMTNANEQTKTAYIKGWAHAIEYAAELQRRDNRW